VCVPVATARQFLRRYALDTVARLKSFGRVRRRGAAARVLHGDARELSFEGCFDGVVTSPPYPGLIDYHEQHRYAYELLGLEDCRKLELGAAAEGTGKKALERYCEGIAAVLVNVRSALRRGAPVIVVVNDRRELYPRILDRAGLRLEDRLRRHVNRRTGRRAGEFFEDVLVARSG
jgi:DNA modification methylase